MSYVQVENIRVEKYEKVLKLMQDKGGRVAVNDADLSNLLGRLAYRIPTYMSQIRRQAKLEVKNIREGRKVVAYELAALAPTTDCVSAQPAETPAPATV